MTGGRASRGRPSEDHRGRSGSTSPTVPVAIAAPRRSGWPGRPPEPQPPRKARAPSCLPAGRPPERACRTARAVPWRRPGPSRSPRRPGRARQRPGGQRSYPSRIRRRSTGSRPCRSVPAREARGWRREPPHALASGPRAGRASVPMAYILPFSVKKSPKTPIVERRCGNIPLADISASTAYGGSRPRADGPDPGTQCGLGLGPKDHGQP